MKRRFSARWKASRQPRKQRKYQKNAPLHIRQRFMHANLSKELRKKTGMRSIGVKKSDKVKVMRGNLKGKAGKVNRVDRKNNGVYIDGIEREKRDSTKAFIRIHPSNIMIIDFGEEDKKRKKREKRKK